MMYVVEATETVCNSDIEFCASDGISESRLSMIRNVNDVVNFHLSGSSEIESLTDAEPYSSVCRLDILNLIRLRLLFIQELGVLILNAVNDSTLTDLLASIHPIKDRARRILLNLSEKDSTVTCMHNFVYPVSPCSVFSNPHSSSIDLMSHIEPLLALLGKWRHQSDVLLLGSPTIGFEKSKEWIHDETVFAESIKLEDVEVVIDISFINESSNILLYEPFPTDLPEHIAKVVPNNKRQHPLSCWQRYRSPASRVDSLTNCLASKHFDSDMQKHVWALLSSFKPVPGKSLIYTCRGYKPCGGNGDRMNGIVHVFILSLLLKRTFLIDSEFPLPLHLVLAPRLIDWRMPQTMIPDISVDYIDKRLEFVSDLSSLIRNRDSAIAITTNHLLMMKIIDHPLFPIPELRTVPFLFSHLFKFLFLPTVLISRELPDTSFLGIHFRSGNHGNWYDPERHGFGDLNMFFECARMLEASFGKSLPWILFSDVAEKDLSRHLNFFEEYRSGKLSVYDSAPVHTDRSSLVASVAGGFVGAWEGWLTMTRAAGLVISRSFFSETAARVARMSGQQVRFYEQCVRVDLS